jgi:hypothetical protein
MIKFTQEEVEKMDKETLINEVMKNIYEAAELLEQAQDAGLLFGNGHHMRQAVSHSAKKIIKKQWSKQYESN